MSGMIMLMVAHSRESQQGAINTWILYWSSRPEFVPAKSQIMQRGLELEFVCMCILQPFYLQGWLAQSPVQTSCPSWQSTGKPHHHSSTFLPRWDSLDWAQWNERCCRGRWSLHCDTMTAHTHLSHSHCRTATPCYQHCLLLFEGWPLPSRALQTEIREMLVFQGGIRSFCMVMTGRDKGEYCVRNCGVSLDYTWNN